MIYIKPKDKQVELKFNVDVGTGWNYSFSWNCNDEVYAQLLAAQMNKQLGNKLELIRREAYDQGFKDAKAKRAKREWFLRVW
jgi:hypothetical protein